MDIFFHAREERADSRCRIADRDGHLNSFPEKFVDEFRPVPEISILISFITVIASVCIRVISVPPLNASYRSRYVAFKYPSAIWERAELWVQINSTFFFMTSPGLFHRSDGLHVPLFPPYHLFLSESDTFMSPISTGTSTSGPMTVANAAGEAIPNTAMATAIAMSRWMQP